MPEPTTTAATEPKHVNLAGRWRVEAVRFAEHAQALGLLKAITIVKETPCTTT